MLSLKQKIINFMKTDYRSLNCGFMINPYSFGGITPFNTLYGDTSLKAYWKFNEVSGDIINQSAAAADLGAAADLQVTGATYSSTPIILSQNSLYFDGINDYSVSGTSLTQFNSFMSDNGAVFSVVMWIKQASTEQLTRGLFATTQGSANKDGFMIQFEDGTSASKKNLRLYTQHASTIDVDNLWVDCMNDDTNLHQLILTCTDGGNSELWVDGVSKGTKAANQVSGSANAWAAYLGSLPAPSAYSNIRVSEWSVWNKILSSAEIGSLYNSGLGRSIY